MVLHMYMQQSSLAGPVPAQHIITRHNTAQHSTAQPSNPSSLQQAGHRTAWANTDCTPFKLANVQCNTAPPNTSPQMKLNTPCAQAVAKCQAMLGQQTEECAVCLSLHNLTLRFCSRTRISSSTCSRTSSKTRGRSSWRTRSGSCF